MSNASLKLLKYLSIKTLNPNWKYIFGNRSL